MTNEDLLARLNNVEDEILKLKAAVQTNANTIVMLSESFKTNLASLIEINEQQNSTISINNGWLTNHQEKIDQLSEQMSTQNQVVDSMTQVISALRAFRS